MIKAESICEVRKSRIYRTEANHLIPKIGPWRGSKIEAS